MLYFSRKNVEIAAKEIDFLYLILTIKYLILLKTNVNKF